MPILPPLTVGGLSCSRREERRIESRQESRRSTWLNHRGRRDEPRLFTAETRPRRDGHFGRPRREISSQLLVPMYYDGAIIGILTLTSADGRRPFSDSVARYGRALGDLAAVAMHRAEALHRERDARAQAEDAVQTRDRVVSIVSHDLRNPLTAILGGADFLLEIIPEDEPRAAVREQLQRMRHAATTMNRLIVDLLDIARLESGPLPMHFKELNVVQVVDNALDLFQSSARHREVTLERPAAAGLPMVWGDPDRLIQLLSNLLGNALKATPKGGSVGVRVTQADKGVELCVHDTGPGIPPERLQHLFDRFWHVTHAHKSGLGLGSQSCAQSPRRMTRRFRSRARRKAARLCDSCFRQRPGASSARISSREL